jgi:hypothetical protein
MRGISMNIFKKHPSSVGETYFQHLRHALWFGIRMFLASLVCICHAFLPFLFQTTGSRMVADLYVELQKRKSNATPM